MSFIEIPKWDGSDDIKCICGENTNIGYHHIHPDGRITASYYHYYHDRPEKMQGCGWHVFLDWKGGEFWPENGRTDY